MTVCSSCFLGEAQYGPVRQLGLSWNLRISPKWWGWLHWKTSWSDKHKIQLKQLKQSSRNYVLKINLLLEFVVGIPQISTAPLAYLVTRTQHFLSPFRGFTCHVQGGRGNYGTTTSWNLEMFEWPHPCGLVTNGIYCRRYCYHERQSLWDLHMDISAHYPYRTTEPYCLAVKMHWFTQQSLDQLPGVISAAIAPKAIFQQNALQFKSWNYV